MKWTIDKSFDFCYGHRVHNQELNADFTGSAGACLACRHLHGHQGLIKVYLSSHTLARGMVVDFKMLGWFKDFIDDVLDHKFIMDLHDPLAHHECPEYAGEQWILHKLMVIDTSKCHSHPEGYWTPNISILPKDVHQAVIEKYEGIVFVDFVPTSENIAAWLLGIARHKMAKLGIDVSSVEFWETPKSHCKVMI